MFGSDLTKCIPVTDYKSKRKSFFERIFNCPTLVVVVFTESVGILLVYTTFTRKFNDLDSV